MKCSFTPLQQQQQLALVVTVNRKVVVTGTPLVPSFVIHRDNGDAAREAMPA